MCALRTLVIVGLLVGVSALSAQTTEVVRGRIVEVREAARQVVVKSSDDKEKVFQVPDKAALENEGKPAKLGDFRKDTDVRIGFQSRDGRNEVVSMTTL